MTQRTALLTYAALIGLLALTVGSTFVPLGVGNSLINLAVALAKAALIGVVFMHLRRSSILISLTVAALGFWLLLLFGVTLVDYFTR
jgi:cytochrome c oxidase subunit 4